MATETLQDKIIDDFRVSVRRLDDLKTLGFGADEIHRLVIPRRTLDRRIASDNRLSLEESDRLARLEAVAERADRVFGDKEKARRWLRKPNRALDGICPIDLLISETGARRVENVLGAIEFGMFS